MAEAFSTAGSSPECVIYGFRLKLYRQESRQKKTKQTMSEQVTTPTVEDEIAELKEAAGRIERGEDPIAPQPAAETTEPPAGSPEDGDGEPQETGSTEEVDAGTETTDTEVIEPEGELEGEPEGEPTEPEPETRADKKDKSLTRSWDNAKKRHDEADVRRTEQDSREAQLIQREQAIKNREVPAPDDPHPNHSTKEIVDSINEFLTDGDVDTARAIIEGLGQKAEANRNHADTGPQSPQFKEMWETHRVSAIQENPDLAKSDSALFKQASELLASPWGEVLGAHPAGVKAAVEVAKLRMSADSVPALTKQVEELQTEIKKLKERTQLGGTGATTRGAPSKGKPQTVEQEIAGLYRDAQRRG
jgi:hypothetical protein